MNCNTRRFVKDDIALVIPMYIDYFNNVEGGEWTEHTVQKRLSQIVSREDFYGLITYIENEPAAFAVGYFEQFDDGIAYDLVEIVVATEHQNKGIGTYLMGELERRAKEKGAFTMSLQAVNDDRHDRFYGRLGYGNTKNFVLKCKLL